LTSAGLQIVNYAVTNRIAFLCSIVGECFSCVSVAIHAPASVRVEHTAAASPSVEHRPTMFGQQASTSTTVTTSRVVQEEIHQQQQQQYQQPPPPTVITRHEQGFAPSLHSYTRGPSSG